MKRLLFFLLISFSATAQQPVITAKNNVKPERLPLVRDYLSPGRVLLQDGVTNAAALLLPGNGQGDLSNKNMCILKKNASLLLDFDKELHGGLQLVTGMSPAHRPIKLRIRFGESVSEAMSNIEPEKNATNDHAMRDMIVEVPWLGKLEVGNTGFRFVRIDMLDSVDLQLKEARAIAVYRDIPYLGSFRCNDERLNEIWATGAYTVHLNMQEYLWDGIKRDRLVWIGDMHPEVATINAVFGNNDVVTKSLDLTRDITPLPGYMNGMVSYSMWWVIIQRDWYMKTGDIEYLRQQSAYLKALLAHFQTKIGKDGREALDGNRFLDWPSSEDKAAIHAGLHAMLLMCMDAGAELSAVLGDRETADNCKAAAVKLKKYIPAAKESKQAAALLALSGLAPADKMNKEVIAVCGVKNYSTFYGYYMLQAKAKAGDYVGAMNDIRTYWGAMLDLGATTFWEDFNMDWIPGAGRIDTFVTPGQKDIHGDYGAYCYKGFRHSFCHGWASGPTAWLTEHVLGVQVLEPGCKRLLIKPNLGNLTYVEGTFPTPKGIVHIRHFKRPDGSIGSDIKSPPGVKVDVQY